MTKINTVKRLILIEASLQQCPLYRGKFNKEYIVLHSATQIIDQVYKGIK